MKESSEIFQPISEEDIETLGKFTERPRFYVSARKVPDYVKNLARKGLLESSCVDVDGGIRWRYEITGKGLDALKGYEYDID